LLCIEFEKAAEDSRAPRPGGVSCAHEHALASWSAAVLCRFNAWLPICRGFKLVAHLQLIDPEAID